MSVLSPNFLLLLLTLRPYELGIIDCETYSCLDQVAFLLGVWSNYICVRIIIIQSGTEGKIGRSCSAATQLKRTGPWASRETAETRKLPRNILGFECAGEFFSETRGCWSMWSCSPVNFAFPFANVRCMRVCRRFLINVHRGDIYWITCRFEYLTDLAWTRRMRAFYHVCSTWHGRRKREEGGERDRQREREERTRRSIIDWLAEESIVSHSREMKPGI